MEITDEYEFAKAQVFPLYIVIEYISKVISDINLSKLRRERNKSNNVDRQRCLFTDVLLYGIV